MKNEKTRYSAFAIVEQINQKAKWLKLGPAFENKDGSMTAMCNVIPMQAFATGVLKINIREDKPREDVEAGQEVQY